MPFYLLIKNFTENNVLVDDIISIIFIDNSRFYLKDTILADNFYFEKGQGIRCFLWYVLLWPPVFALYAHLSPQSIKICSKKYNIAYFCHTLIIQKKLVFTIKSTSNFFFPLKAAILSIAATIHCEFLIEKDSIS